MALSAKGQVAWLEPLREWIKDAENLTETALTPTLSLKKSSAIPKKKATPSSDPGFVILAILFAVFVYFLIEHANVLWN